MCRLSRSRDSSCTWFCFSYSFFFYLSFLSVYLLTCLLAFGVLGRSISRTRRSTAAASIYQRAAGGEWTTWSGNQTNAPSPDQTPPMSQSPGRRLGSVGPHVWVRSPGMYGVASRSSSARPKPRTSSLGASKIRPCRPKAFHQKHIFAVLVTAWRHVTTQKRKSKKSIFVS